MRQPPLACTYLLWLESSVDGCPSEVQVSTAIKTALNAEATATGNFTNVQRQALSPALPLALQAKHSIRAAFGRPIARSEVINVVKLRDPDNLWSSSLSEPPWLHLRRPAGRVGEDQNKSNFLVINTDSYMAKSTNRHCPNGLFLVDLMKTGNKDGNDGMKDGSGWHQVSQ